MLLCWLSLWPWFATDFRGSRSFSFQHFACTSSSNVSTDAPPEKQRESSLSPNHPFSHTFQTVSRYVGLYRPVRPLWNFHFQLQVSIVTRHTIILKTSISRWSIVGFVLFPSGRHGDSTDAGKSAFHRRNHHKSQRQGSSRVQHCRPFRLARILAREHRRACSMRRHFLSRRAGEEPMWVERERQNDREQERL